MRNEPCWCGSGRKQKKCHKDVMPNSALANLEMLYKQVDSKISDNVWSLPCQKGCAQCCYDHFSVSSVEWYYIMSNIWEKYGIEKVEEIVDKGYNLWLEVKEQAPELAKKFETNLSSNSAEHDKFLDKKFQIMLDTMDGVSGMNAQPCIFLDQETNSCSIYELRPFICRKFGVSYTDSDKEHNISACDIIIKDIEKYHDEMVNLSEFDKQEKELTLIELKKYNAYAQDRVYPFFYLCKIQKGKLDTFKQKIMEFRQYSLEEVYTLKAGRL